MGRRKDFGKRSRRARAATSAAAKNWRIKQAEKKRLIELGLWTEPKSEDSSLVRVIIHI